MQKLLLAGIAVLLLATGTAHAGEFVLLLQKGDEKPSTAFATMGMNCEEALASHERNRKAGTWLMYSPPGGGEPWRIVWLGCLSAVSKMHCPTIAGQTPESGRTC